MALQPAQPPPAFDHLPDELLLRVLYFLDVSELLSTSRVGNTLGSLQSPQTQPLTLHLLVDFPPPQKPLP